MRFYKILKDGKIVDANFVFLKWDQNSAGLKFLVECDIEDAHYIQTTDQKEIYRVNWLNPVEDNGEFETVEATLISEDEFREIRDQLDEGETPINPEPEPEPGTEPELSTEPEPSTEPDSEEVMTVEVMRREIIELKKQAAKKDERIDYLEQAMIDVGEILYG